MSKALLLSISSAILLSVGWLGVSGLPLLVAFVPLLMISRHYGKGRRNFWKTFGWTALALGLWSAVTTWWIWHAVWIGAVLSVLITILLFGGVFMLYHYISKRAPMALAYTILASGWIALEYLYTVGQVSFPWLVLGNGLAGDTAFIQWYDTTGVFGGSLWVWICNIAIFNAIVSRRVRSAVTAIIFLLVPAAISLTKFYTYQEPEQAVKVAVVQPNIEPYTEKFTLPQAQQTEILVRLAEEAPRGTDFIVMPETAIHENIWENNITYNPIIEQLRNLARERYPQAQFIVGASSYRRYMPGERIPQTARTSDGIDYWYDAYNTAMGVDGSDTVQIHHKSKLVVGVEKMPYYNLLRHLEWLIVDLGGTTGQLGTDSVRRVFTSPQGIKTGTAICFESVYGAYCAEFVRGGAQLLFIITNDGWWGDTPGYRQHFSFARLRAIEMRRAIARSANTGISGFISPRGDVLASVGWDERATLHATLPLNDKITLYARYGDYIARVCIYVSLLCLLYYIAYRVKRRNNLV
jgi:apolipoprotein N-acyltransferase